MTADTRIDDRDQWEGQLRLSPGAVHYHGPGGRAERHSHLAIQFIRSEAEPFAITMDGSTIEARAALVPSGTPHSFEAFSQIDLALIEPAGPTGVLLGELATRLKGKDLIDRLSADATTPTDLIQALDSDRQARAEDRDLSPTVLRAIAYIENALREVPRLDEAAKAAHLSPSRLTHLFSTEVGIPFRRYVLWARIRRMVLLIKEGENLTQAAHGAGFSDSAHLSRVFKQHFGLPPSALLQMELVGDWPDQAPS